MEDSMLAYHDVSTGSFADPLYGLDEDHEWRDERRSGWLDIDEMPATNLFSAEDDIIDQIEDAGEDIDADIFPIDIQLWDEDEVFDHEIDDTPDLTDTHKSQSTPPDESEEELITPTAQYSRNRTNIARLSESDDCYRLFRKYRNKRKNCGKKRSAPWQVGAGRHRQRQSTRFASPHFVHRMAMNEYLDGVLN